MNPKINKVVDEIEKTKAKIADLQGRLPTLERKRNELENKEIVRLVRLADVAPHELAEFIASIGAGQGMQGVVSKQVVGEPTEATTTKNTFMKEGDNSEV